MPPGEPLIVTLAKYGACFGGIYMVVLIVDECRVWVSRFLDQCASGIAEIDTK